MQRLGLLIGILLIGGFAVPQVPVLQHLVGVEQAQAQVKKKKRRTFFDVLIERRNKARERRKLRREQRKLRLQKKVRVREDPLATDTLSSPQVVVVKAENAPKLLIVGDFMAGSLASGIERLYSDRADIVVVDQVKTNSGLVRDDVKDWPTDIAGLIDEVKPIAVVNLIGMNDRQQMRLSSGRTQKLSPEWLAEYNARAERLASVVAAKNIPLLWVGLPPVNSSAMNSDYLAFNGIYFVGN